MTVDTTYVPHVRFTMSATTTLGGGGLSGKGVTLSPLAAVGTQAQVSGALEVLVDYPWMRVTRQRGIRGYWFTLGWTEDMELDDFALFHEHICPDGRLMDMERIEHPSRAMWVETLTYWQEHA